jgi:hypothetical protein
MYTSTKNLLKIQKLLKYSTDSSYNGLLIISSGITPGGAFEKVSSDFDPSTRSAELLFKRSCLHSLDVGNC